MMAGLITHCVAGLQHLFTLLPQTWDIMTVNERLLNNLNLETF